MLNQPRCCDDGHGPDTTRRGRPGVGDGRPRSAAPGDDDRRAGGRRRCGRRRRPHPRIGRHGVVDGPAPGIVLVAGSFRSVRTYSGLTSLPLADRLSRRLVDDFPLTRRRGVGRRRRNCDFGMAPAERFAGAEIEPRSSPDVRSPTTPLDPRDVARLRDAGPLTYTPVTLPLLKSSTPLVSSSRA